MTLKTSTRIMRTPIFALSAFTLAALVNTPASALDFELGPVHAQLDSRVGAGMQWRVEKRAKDLVGIANGGTSFSTNTDDGNLAFNNGDVVYGGFTITSDLTVTWKDFGIFARGNAGWNGAQAHKHYFDEKDYDDTLTTRGYTQADRRRKESQIHQHVGNYAELLDLYAYTSGTILGQSVAVRVGKQAINWGESTLVLNGLNSILAFDANRFRVPGFELDEVITPSNNIWVSTSLGYGMSLEAFYQLRWERTLIDASGTYLSVNDFAGIGGNNANLGFGRANENTLPSNNTTNPCSPPASPVTGLSCTGVGSFVPRAPDVTPGNDGQYGAALRFTIPYFNEMDLSFYGANYHSRLPLYSGISRTTSTSLASTARYFVEYPKDIQIYGVSFNTTIPWDFALQGEYSLKKGQPLQIDDIELLLTGLGASSQLAPAGTALGNRYIRGWRRKDVSQADIGLTRLFGPAKWLGNDQTIVLVEAAAMRVHDMEPQSVLRYEGPGTNTPGNATTAFGNGVPQQTEGYATETSWGYRILARFDYNNAIGAINIKPSIRWDHDVEGTSPTPILNFVEGRQQLSTAIGFSYLGNINGEIGYTRYMGAGNANLIRDRDSVQASIHYSF